LAQDKWLIFKSTSVRSSADTPPFTILYPPNFMRTVDADDEDEVQSFELDNFDTKKFILMTIMNAGAMSSEEMAEIKKLGWPLFWKTVAERMKQGRGVLNGIKTLNFKGIPACEMFFTDTMTSKEGEEFSLFRVQRLLIKNNQLLVFVCLVTLPTAEAEEENYSAEDNPEFWEFFQPHFDSLEFIN
jgi:hypothetical protein